MLDSVIKVNKKYYPQILLEKFKYEINKNKMENLINDNLKQISSDDESDNKSDNNLTINLNKSQNQDCILGTKG